MYPHSIPSIPTCDPPTPTDPPTPADDPLTYPRRTIRDMRAADEEARRHEKPVGGHPWRHPDYPLGPPALGDVLRDADEGPYAGIRPALPPSACNTRAENSQGVDYVGLTCSYDRSLRTFASLLRIPEEGWDELPHGGHFFLRCFKWGSVRVYCNGKEGMGSYCQISGDGCRELEATGKIRDWQEFAIACVETYALKCVRLDLFKDDRQGLLDIGELEGKFREWACTTHAQEFERRSKQAKGMGGQRITDTLNIGSRKSDSFMRIYDKTLELRPKGRKIEDWQAEHGHHVRVELELKRKRAHAAMNRLAQTGFGEGLIPGLIRGFIDFKESDASGHNGRRLPTWAPWLEFLQDEAKVMLGVDYVQPTLDKALHYHSRQYGPTMAVQFMRLGGDVEAITSFVVKVAQDGKKRMRPRHYRLLDQAMGGVAA